MKQTKPYTAIILAADRDPDDPVAQSVAVSCKALTPVLGREMVLRVLDALAEADQIDQRLLAGPPIVAVEQKEHEQIFPQPGWVEHDPLEIWQNTQEVIRGALAKANITGCWNMTITTGCAG